MKFKCFDCGELFAENSQITTHLKQIHKYKDKSDSLKCFVNKTDQCPNTFQSFNNLQRHVRKCLERSDIPVSSIQPQVHIGPAQNNVGIRVVCYFIGYCSKSHNSMVCVYLFI